MTQSIDAEPANAPEGGSASGDATEPTGSPQVAVERSGAQDPAATGVFRRRLGLARRRVLVGALLPVLVAAVAVPTVLGWKLHERNETDASSRAALAAAEQYAVALTSIDFNRIDAGFAAIHDGATGAVENMYGPSADRLKALLVQGHSVSKGRVLDAAVQSAARDEVVVLLFVDADVTNSTSPQPRTDRTRVVLTMKRVGGRWLAANVDIE